MATPLALSGRTLAFVPLWVMSSPVATLATETPKEAQKFQRLAQVLPTPGATNTRVSGDATNPSIEIGGGTQTGGNLFHRFDRFDLEAGQVANFLTNPGLEAIFSQIGGGPSTIDGLLQVSGSQANLFVINPAGILFGPNARLDLSGSFLATTADRLQVGGQWIDLLGEGITAQTAVAGSLEALTFSVNATGGVILNQGELAVGDGKALGLFGNAIVNTGSLTAPGGELTVLAASGGQQVSLAGGLLNLDLTTIQAARGRTEHRLGSSVAQPVAQSVAQAVAQSVAQPVAEAAGLRINQDGSVSLQAGTTIVTGNVNVAAADAAGGQATILGDDVRLTHAIVDASGASGGEIRIGGDYQGRGEILRAASTQVDAASVLRANGIAAASEIRPDGGTVIVWSDGRTAIAGEATAQSLAPGGDGGLVETSGRQQLAIAPTTKVNTTAIDGLTGEWLLDPADLEVVAAGGAATVIGGTNSPTTASTIDRPTLEAGLDGNNVNLQATNSITVNAEIDTTGNAGAGNLQLTAPTLNLNQPLQLNGSLSGTATLANVAATGSIQNGLDAVASGGTVNLISTFYAEGQPLVINKSLTLPGLIYWKKENKAGIS